MAITRPNIDGSSIGARWVLKKHTAFKKEYANLGTVDLSGGGTFTDTDGDDWTVVSSAATTYELGAGGILMKTGAGASVLAFGINPLSVIPGLRKRDPLWAIWKIVGASLPNNTNNALIRMLRRPSVGADLQYGGFRMLRNAGANQLNPRIVTPDTTGGSATGEAPNVLGGAFPDRLYSINVSGLRYEYRSQLASAAFPEIPDPDEIDLFTPGVFGGSFSGDTLLSPTTEDIALATEQAQINIDSAAAGICELTLEEFWLYRYE